MNRSFISIVDAYFCRLIVKTCHCYVKAEIIYLFKVIISSFSLKHLSSTSFINMNLVPELPHYIVHSRSIVAK